MTWLTVKINPPVLDKPILARTADEYGYGHNYEVFTFDSTVFTEEDAEMHLTSRDFIEWMEIPE